jgi:hypothetical protein
MPNKWAGRSSLGRKDGGLVKPTDAHPDEFEWRFNNRQNPYMFLDTTRGLVSSPQLEYKESTKNRLGFL